MHMITIFFRNLCVVIWGAVTRKKQAEFLVKDYVYVNCISCIVVYNKDNKLFVEKIVSKLDLEIPVLINPDSKYYY